MNLTELLQNKIGPALAEKATSLLGLNSSDASNVASKLLSSTTTALSHKASTAEGATALFNSLTTNSTIADKAEDLFNRFDRDSQVDGQAQGGELLNAVLGDKSKVLQKELALSTGLTEDNSQSMLNIGMPYVASSLKGLIKSENLSAAGFSNLMADQIRTPATATAAAAATAVVGTGQAVHTSKATNKSNHQLNRDTNGAAFIDKNKSSGGNGVFPVLVAAATLAAVVWGLVTCTGPQGMSKNSAADTTSNVVENAASTVASATESVVETVADSTSAVAEVASDTANAGIDLVKSATEGAGTLVASAVESVKDTADSAVDTAKSVVEGTTEAASSVATGAQEAVADAADKMHEVSLPDGTALTLSAGSPVDKILSFLKDENSSVPESFILRGLNFDTASARITENSAKIIEDLTATLKAYGDVKISLKGHTDSRGDAAKNQALSQSRAESVAAALIESGIETGRLVAKGFGKEKPIADNATEEGQLENRRVEVIITEK